MSNHQKNPENHVLRRQPDWADLCTAAPIRVGRYPDIRGVLDVVRDGHGRTAALLGVRLAPADRTANGNKGLAGAPGADAPAPHLRGAVGHGALVLGQRQVRQGQGRRRGSGWCGREVEVEVGKWEGAKFWCAQVVDGEEIWRCRWWYGWLELSIVD